jgi:hypothetical protein
MTSTNSRARDIISIVEGACAFLFVRSMPSINGMLKPLDKARTNH